jgi:threonine dehydrogenase-like Zn-dependent dehydrogenase
VAVPRRGHGRRAVADGARVRRDRRGRRVGGHHITPGQFVVGSFFASDNTCEICRAGYQTSCLHREILGTPGAAQSQRMRVPLDEAAAGYQAMDTRQAIKVLLRP